MNPEDRAWAAGLFVGEGWCGTVDRRNGTLTYVSLTVSMLDERAVARFAEIVGRPYYWWELSYDKARQVYRCQAIGRTAERILTELFPAMIGTDKGDQTIRAFKAAKVPLARDGVYVERPRVVRDQSGKNNPNAKLNKRKATAIRKKYAKGGCTYKSLAAEHGVSSSAIRSIILGRTWN